MKVKMEEQASFITEGRSSVKLKLNAKGVVTAEVKIYKDDTHNDVDAAYQLACEIIDRIKQRYLGDK